MKRKFRITDIEIVLPKSLKRIKISNLTITLKNKMSTTEFNDELEYLLSKDRKFPNAQQPRYDNDLEEDDQLNDDHSHDQTYDSDDNSALTVRSDEIVDDQSIEALSEISEIETDIVSLLDNKDEISDNGNEEIVRSPRSHDKWDKMANDL